MHCEDANHLLVEYAEGTLPHAVHERMEAHITECANCQSDYTAISDLRTMASNWHDEVPPAWAPPGLDRPNHLEQFLQGFRQWFPTFASAAALVLVTVMYVQPQDTSQGTLPAQQLTDYNALPELPQATQAAFDNALEDNREQRQQELKSLLEILTAEMNRRSIETEESLKFLVSSQIQGQKELDSLYQQVQDLLDEENASASQGGGTPREISHDRIFEGVSQ